MSTVALDTLERAAWMRAPESMLTDHGPCCARARAWLIAMARSHDFASTDGLTFAAPSWLNQRWTWGPGAGRSPGARPSNPKPSIATSSVSSRWRSSARRESRPIPARCCARTPRRTPRTGVTSGRRCRARSTRRTGASSATRSASCASMAPGACLRSDRRRLAGSRDLRRTRRPHRDPCRAAAAVEMGRAHPGERTVDREGDASEREPLVARVHSRRAREASGANRRTMSGSDRFPLVRIATATADSGSAKPTQLNPPAWPKQRLEPHQP